MERRNGKGVAVGDALVTRSPIVPRWFISVAVVFLLIGLFFSRPTAKQFYNSVWIQALDGIKAEREEQRSAKPLGRVLVDAAKVSPLGPLIGFLQNLKESEIESLPSLWMANTETHDWKLATYFLYREESCYSDYIGIGGTLMNLHDGCEVERYRRKGGAST